MDLSPLTDIVAKLQALKSNKIRRTHNYMTPKYGQYANDLLAAWARDGFKPMQISCHHLRVRSETLKCQLQQGVNWIIENSPSEKSANFWRDIKLHIRYETRNNTLLIEKRGSIVESAHMSNDLLRLDLQADFLAWVSSNPPMHPRSGSKWPANSATFTYQLELEDVDWFTTQLGHIKNDGFIGVIRIDNILFVRYPVPGISA